MEVGLRVLGMGPLVVNPDQRDFWRYDANLGWRSRPGASGRFRTDQFDAFVSINSKGLRDDETTVHKPRGTRRVVVVGDSFSWGFGVGQDETFSAHLEDLLSNTEVINGGTSGYSTDQSLLWLRDHGIRYAPDVVLYQMAGNDDTVNRMRRIYWVYYKPSFHLGVDGLPLLQGVPVPRASSTELLRHWLRSHLALARSLEAALIHRRDLFMAPANPPPDPDDPHRLTLALVDAMRDEAKRVGASFLVLTNSEFWHPGAGSYQRLVNELQKAGHDIIAVEALRGWDPEAMKIPDDGHWNAAGHRFIATGVAEKLRRDFQWAEPPAAAH
jgi:lysophospholipase L1-like esterase